MGVQTRKRAVAAIDQPAPHSPAKRFRATQAPSASSPQKSGLTGSPGLQPAKQTNVGVLKKGSRGAAFLAAAGITVPSAASPPRLPQKKASAGRTGRPAASHAPASLAAPPTAALPRNPLLAQELPKKLTVLFDMFAGVQTVHQMMKRRGQRTTYQNMRQAVEEASGRRFLISHVAQLQHLLPEAIAVEWVRLPVAAHSSRTEPHLLISLDGAAAAAAAVGAGIAAAGSDEMQATRGLVRCRLAEHLLHSYKAHLGTQAEQLRQNGDEAGAAVLVASAAEAEQPPVTHFLAPFPEEVEDVPQKQLPPRPEAASSAARGGSPAMLGAAAAAPLAAAAAVQQLAVPSTPASPAFQPPQSTAGRQGRPPMHPSTIDRHRQRRLSFSQQSAAAAAAAARPAYGLSGKPVTPLDKLNSHLERQQEEQQDGKEAAADMAAEVHPSQVALAASLGPAGLQFGCAATVLSQDDATLLASMPAELRRLSTDGIISMDTLRKLDAAEQQHRRLSGKEAVERRDSNAALGQLPRTFSRLQRIFGMQGPNALKLRDVVLRIKQGGEEMSTEGQIESQIRALAEHAPEYVSFKPFGRCGTPALWINRAVKGNAIMQRLKQVADGRLLQRDQAVVT